MSNKLNQHGDKMLTMSGMHGPDISSQRMDELDKSCISYAMKIFGHDNTHAIDIGCGLGAQSLRLAGLGFQVSMLDLLNLSEFSKTANSLFGRELLLPLCKDARDLKVSDLPLEAAIVYSQRFLHYLRYDEAKHLLSKIKTNSETRFYLSASGLNSELGEEYADFNVSIKQRYCSLSPDMIKKHKIHGPVCLYTELDMEHLAKELNLEPLSIWTSDFGNIKAILSPMG